MALLLLRAAVLGVVVATVGCDVSVVWSGSGRAWLPCAVPTPDRVQTRRPPPPLDAGPDADGRRHHTRRTAYLWRRGDEEFTAKRVLPNGTLEVPRRSNGSAQGVYQCGVKSHGSIVLGYPVELKYAYIDKQTPATVTVTAAPMAGQPSNFAAVLGQAVVFSCGIKSAPPPSITWYKGDEKISNNTRLYFVESQLIITQVRKEDAGAYRCVATNEVLNKTRASMQSTLLVTSGVVGAPPAFLLEPMVTNITGDMGGQVVLACAVAGYPTPEILWEFTPLMGGGAMELDSTDQVLVRTELTPEQEGVYTCSFARAGSKRTFNVTLRGDVKIIHPPTDKALPRASTVRFNCTATGHPTPVITWYKNGTLINTGGRIRLLKSASDDRIELVIGGITSEDAGVYQCFASGAGAVTSAWAALEVTGWGAPAPRALSCRPLDARRVRLRWTHDSPDDVFVYTVHVTPMEESGNSQPGMPHKNQSETVTLERALTAYRLQVRAYLKLSPQASHASDMSLAVLCQGQGVPFRVTKLEDGKVLVTWAKFTKEVPDVQKWMLQVKPENTSDITNHTLDGVVTNYTLNVSKDESFEIRVLGTRTGEWVEQDLSELPWVSTRHAGNHSDYGEVPPAPTSLQVTRVTSHSIALRWKEMKDAPYVYTLCVSSPMRERDDAPSCRDSKVSWVEVSGLQPDTEYEIRVQARAARPGAFSQPVYVATIPEESQRFKQLSYARVNASAVRVWWEVEPAMADARYTLHYAPRLRLPVDAWAQRSVHGNSALLTDLDPMEKTYVMVTAHDPTEHSHIITVPKYNTKTDLSSLSWERSGTGVSLHWMAVGSSTGCSVSYSQNITQPIEQWPTVEFNMPNVMLSGMDDSSTTFVSVQCAGGSSRMLNIPPLKETNTSLYIAVGAACVGCVAAVALAVALALWRRRKRARTQHRSRRRHVSGEDSNEEEGSELKVVGVRLANGGGAGQPLLNGHVHITENPALSKTPNGKVKKGRSCVTDVGCVARGAGGNGGGVFDLSREGDVEGSGAFDLSREGGGEKGGVLDLSREAGGEGVGVRGQAHKLPDDNMNSEMAPTLQPNG